MLTDVGQSLSVRLARLTEPERAEVLDGLDASVQRAIVRSWAFERREAQTSPVSPFFIWAIRGGRGSGKTRGATEWYTERVKNGSQWNHLLSRTHADVRDTMIQGESGLIEVAHARDIDAVYEPSKRRLYYPDFKSQALIFGAQEPDESRGPQCETGWVDEFSTFPKKVDRVGNTALTNFIFGCRLGKDPRIVVSFTPKTTASVKALIDRADDPNDTRVVMTTMSLYDNLANLPETFIDEVLSAYKGTRLEAQEILGLYLSSVEGALWTPELLDRQRVDTHPILDRIIIGVDPPGETSAECGIVVVGVEANRTTRRSAYVLADLSIKGPPEVWAHRVIEARNMFGATRIVAEVNQGWDMVRACINAVDPDQRVEKVTAHESKRARAEPVELLYEAGRVWHVGSIAQFMELEAQQTGWVPDDPEATSPDRLDACVWAISSALGTMNAASVKTSTAAAMRIPDVGGRL